MKTILSYVKLIYNKIIKYFNTDVPKVENSKKPPIILNKANVLLFNLENSTDEIIKNVEVLNALENYNNIPCNIFAKGDYASISKIIKAIAFGSSCKCVGFDIRALSEDSVAELQVLEIITITEKDIFGNSFTKPIYPSISGATQPVKNYIPFNISFTINKFTSFVIGKLYPHTKLSIRFFIK